MIDYIKCLNCGTEKTRDDTFLDIPLPIKPFGENEAYESVVRLVLIFIIAIIIANFYLSIY